VGLKQRGAHTRWDTWLFCYVGSFLVALSFWAQRTLRRFGLGWLLIVVFPNRVLLASQKSHKMETVWSSRKKDEQCATATCSDDNRRISF
jgi:hypothetical protein